ncbi:energy transducer TonB [Qipengyuania aurantiaca]|uniref:Energy transducer TonB n=1 Tax=Qipengyuania aurantiaca TaxID=2867233 RepID=A0ABX8ZPT4_9SPHN|nr:energy transducer TonB [Qipengyuania aurantiaca]QZD90751.1 energy transducer TonB [Qipengyuania aurantiaca]
MWSLAKSLPSLLAAISIVAPQSAAANDDPTLIVLQPSSPWNLDMGEHKCRIARLFGEGENQTIFLIDQWDPSTTAQWTLAGPALEKYRNGRATEYEFGNGGDAGEFELLGSSFGEFGNAVQSSSGFVTGDPLGDEEDQERDYLVNPLGLPALDAKGAVGIEWLTVSQRGRTPVRLRLGSLEGPLAALNVCMENLVEFWGFDLEEQRRIASPPEVSNMPQVTREVAEHYPNSALRRGAQADFHIRMTIDTQGQIENCVLLSQTVADKFELGGHPCTSFERYARIEPARDKTGQPIRAYLTNRIVYRIP